MANTSQLIKENKSQGGYNKVYPKTFIDAIKDRETGQTLSDILNGFNMYFLSYVGSRGETRLQVPSILRRTGLWITYVMWDKTIVVEWYASDDISDGAFREDSNWRKGNNILVGDITISSNGNWIINGIDSGIKAQGEQGVTPILRVNNNKLEVSYTNGASFNVLSDYIAAWFRWVDTGNGVGKIQISRDNSSWSDLSSEFTNNLKIADYVSSVGELPSGVALGTIYGVGPTYDSSDTSHTNPIYTLYVYTSDGWLDNGHFTSIAAGIVQTIGNNENVVMSQKAVCDVMGLNEYPTFSASKAYSAGDTVLYNGLLYTFNTDHAIGAWDESQVERSNLEKEAEKKYGSYIENEEFIRAYTDAQGKFLWGIRGDGTVEWAKGVPTPVQGALRELESKINTNIEGVNTSIQEKIEYLSSAIDVINAALKPISDTFNYEESPEFINAVTDNEGKVLFGIRENGKPYFPNNEMYHVESNQEFLAAWLDVAGHVLFGLKQDGSTYIAKSDFLDAITNIQTIINNSGIGNENISETIELTKNTFSYTENEEFISATTDSEGHLLEATKSDGKKYFPKQELLEKYNDIEGRTEITLDSEDKILSYRDKDGIKHESKLALDEVYDKNNNKINLATKKDLENVAVDASEINISELDGVIDYSKENLFIVTEFTESFSDGVTTFSPPAQNIALGYRLSNRISCEKGEWFTRNGIATALIVNTDDADENGVKLTNPQSSFQAIKKGYIRVTAINDGTAVLNRGKYVVENNDRKNAIGISKQKLIAQNFTLDTKYLKSPDGSYFEIVVDNSGNISTKKIDKELIPDFDLPNDIPIPSIYKDDNDFDFSSYGFDRILVPPATSNYLFDMKAGGITKLKDIQEYGGYYGYANFEHFYNSNNEGRYGIIMQDGYLRIFDDDFQLIDIVSEVAADAHDFIYIDDGHYILYHSTSRKSVEFNNTTVFVRGTVVKEYKGELMGNKTLIGSIVIDNEDILKEVIPDKTDFYDEGVHCNTITFDGNESGVDTSHILLNLRNADCVLRLSRIYNDDTGEYIYSIVGRLGGRVTSEVYDSVERIKTDSTLQWFHSHDFKFVGMKLIDGKSYPQYSIFDNNWRTTDNPRYSLGTSVEYRNSRLLIMTVDWDNKVIMDYKVYIMSENYYSQLRGMFTRINNICVVSWADMGICGIYDFSSTDNDENNVVIGGVKLWELSISGKSFYRTNIYSLKN